MTSFDGLLHALGGMGLFLLGIVVMTSGLQNMAGDLLRTTLSRFTRSPVSGALTGTVTTALLQSSSATTVAAVGFVAAGLLTFAQALGIVIGANLGTTVTGWLVAIIGFKLQIGALSLPFIFIGMMLRLFGKQRLAHFGFALAGFGLVFTGIGEMQNGMEGLGPLLTPESFPTDSLWGRLELVALGIAITVVTQSSSAGVAAALTALHTDSINFQQAAALVIGMDIGTTLTAALASIGGSVETRRTGLSHVTYNLMTGCCALLLLSPYFEFWQSQAPEWLIAHSELLLVGFHSLFNLLGVIIILPMTHQFAKLMIWLIPEKSTDISRSLDDRMLTQPMVALELVHLTQKRCANKLFQHLHSKTADNSLQTMRFELERTRAYLDRLHVTDQQLPEWTGVMNAIHALDHLFRLLNRLENPLPHPDKPQSPALKQAFSELHILSDYLASHFDAPDFEQANTRSRNHADHCKAQQEIIRHHIMEAVASGIIDTVEGNLQLQQARWQRRVAYHIARICDYMLKTEQLLHPNRATSEAK